jgi:serine/threonine protein kinase
MQYLPLGDLRTCLQKPMPEDEVRTIVEQILQGLQCMRLHDFVHKDLKPAVNAIQPTSKADQID